MVNVFSTTFNIKKFYMLLTAWVDSIVGIITWYGLDGLGFEPQRGRDFLDPYRPALKSTLPPGIWVLGLFAGGKAARVWH